MDIANSLLDNLTEPSYLLANPVYPSLLILLQDGFGKIAAPLMGVLSGYFFIQGLSQKSFPKMLKARVRSLWIPVFIWSGAFILVKMAAAFAISDDQYLQKIWADLDINSISGLGAWPINFPLHYLTDLLKSLLLAPVFIFIYRKYGEVLYALAVGITVLALASFDLGLPVPGQNPNNFLPRADLFLFFYCGVFAYYRHPGKILAIIDALTIRNPFILAGLTALFLATAFHWRWLAAMDTPLTGWASFLILLVTRTSGCLLILQLLPLLSRLLLDRLQPRDRKTFRIFCIHVIIFYVISNITWILAGPDLSPDIMIAVYLVSPPVAVIGAYLSVWIEDLARKLPLAFSQPKKDSGA